MVAPTANSLISRVTTPVFASTVAPSDVHVVLPVVASTVRVAVTVFSAPDSSLYVIV